MHRPPVQSIPLGSLVTVPEPVPAADTVSVWVGVNAAVTVLLDPSVTTQVPVPVQPAPLQPVNAKPGCGVAVSVTTLPGS